MPEACDWWPADMPTEGADHPAAERPDDPPVELWMAAAVLLAGLDRALSTDAKASDRGQRGD